MGDPLAPSFPSGWRVHPCHPNSKEPILDAWPALASDDPVQIAEWAKKYPRCNWALACGPSGVAVLDIDGSTGENSLADFEITEGFFLPATREHRSARGGRHLIFADPQRALRNSASRLGPKLDTRGGNGYIVIPPSTFEGGTYSLMEDRPVADLPEFVVTALGRTREQAKAADGIILDAPCNVGRATVLLRDCVDRGHVAVEGQGGDELTYSLCCEVLSLGLSDEKALEIMEAQWNSHCVPPWSSDELRAKIENAGRYAQNERGALAVAPAEKTFKVALGNILAEQSVEQERTQQKRGRFTPIFARQFLSLPEQRYAVDQLVPDKGITLLYGASGTFKSFLALDLLASSAAGVLAFNKFATVRGDAVMAAGEAPYGLARKRAPAWALARGVSLDDFRFGIVSTVPHVSDESTVKAFVAAQREAGTKPVLVCFDTVARAMGGLDENEARSAGLMIAAAEYVISELGCAVVLVAHSGKDEGKGVRGSSALFAGVDAVFNVSRPKDSLAVKLTCEKMKDADPPPDIHLQGQAIAGSLVFSAITADEFAATSRANPPLSQADVIRGLRSAGAVDGVEVSTNVLAVTMMPANAAGDAKAIAAMERRLRRGAERQLAAYAKGATGRGSTLKWSFPTLPNGGDAHF